MSQHCHCHIVMPHYEVATESLDNSFADLGSDLRENCADGWIRQIDNRDAGGALQ